MQEKIYLDQEFDRFMDKIRRGENFALLRFGDGERAIMENIPVQTGDGWSSPGHQTSLGAALNDALSLDGENVYHGISCPCCDKKAYYWYMTRVPRRENVTFSNLFVNANYRRFLTEFSAIKRDAIVIANHKWGEGKHNNIGSLNVLKFYPVGDDCITFWENEAQNLIESVIHDFGHKNNLLYVVSAGPMSEPIIASLYRNNPQNCYIDFGSSIDIYIHGQDRREYSKPGTVYSQRNCWMFNPKTTNFDVSVILSSYKKPDALSVQLEAIENQTLRPKEILLFQDGIDSYYSLTFKPEILDRFTRVKISPVNSGVWERFRFAMQAESEYVCVFDDDTIPGKRWLENCHFNAQLQEGIYGTVGVILKTPPIYPNDIWRFGWPVPYSKTVNVDFAGHSWFVKREYLEWMFEGTEKYQYFKYIGEDMCLSFKAQQHGISTFIPPHPFYDTELWGSQPEYALKYGIADTAISLNTAHREAMSEAMRTFAADGFKFRINEHFTQVWSLHYRLKFENFKYEMKCKLRKQKKKMKR